MLPVAASDHLADLLRLRRGVLRTVLTAVTGVLSVAVTGTAAVAAGLAATGAAAVAAGPVVIGAAIVGAATAAFYQIGAYDSYTERWVLKDGFPRQLLTSET